MQLTEEHKKAVTEWIAQGAKLSEVQQRLAEELGVRLTYMEARFLMDDLKVVPKDPEPEPKPAQEPGSTPDEEVLPGDDLAGGDALDALEDPAAPKAAGGVAVTLDKVVRAGALVSGKVTFSDGVKAEWYLDQMGRFGLVADDPAYRPSPADMGEFRMVLERELSRQGF